MKKITAFFMAFLPFFVIILLFISGMIVKNNMHIYVSAVEIVESNVDQQKTSDEDKPQIQLHANVLPLNATNPEVTWTPSDDSIIEVDKNGLVTCKDWGEAYVYATSNENQTLSAACKIDVWDDKIHVINISDEYDSSYVGLDQRKKLNIETKPSLSHIKNASLQYTSSDPTVLQVTDDGLLLPQKESTTPVQIAIKSLDPESKAATSTSVKVGAGIDTISFKNPNKEFISDVKYNLYSDAGIIAAPDNTNISASDFTYESDNTTIATISNDKGFEGQINFNLPGSVNFTATYKRNNQLKLSKNIECTCNYLEQVYFTNSDVEITFVNDGQPQYISDESLSWYVYPFKGDKQDTKPKGSAVTIESSDPKVVKVLPAMGDVPPQLQVLGAGDVTLTAYVNSNETVKKLDTCLIHVKLPNDFKLESQVWTDSCYYPLVNNLLIPSNEEYKFEKISFTTSDTENTYIDTNNILHFKKSDIATTITATTGSKTTTFTVNCNAIAKSHEFENKVVIKAGDISQIVGWTPVMDDKSYAQYFDITSDGFIAKRGLDIEQFEVKNDAGKTENIHLICTEDPLYISSDMYPLYTTNDTEVDVRNTIAAKVFPETATKADGSGYEIKYSYKDPVGQTATIENDYISFNNAGAIIVTAQTDFELPNGEKLVQPYTVHSYYGDSFGKFKITHDSAYQLPCSSYETISLDETTNSKTLYCEQVTWNNFDNIRIESTTGLVSVDKQWVGLIATGHVEFTITAPVKQYGHDIVRIFTNTYSVYLNVEVAPKVTEIFLSRSGYELDQNTNKTYTKELTLKVLATPSAVETPTIKYTFNGGEERTVTDNKIVLIGESGWKDAGEDNELTITAGMVSKTYKIQYSEDTPVVTISGVQNNDLYLRFNSTSKTCEIETDGFVDADWYKKNITVNLPKTTGGDEKAAISDGLNILTIKDIPLPADDDPKPYTNTLTLTIAGKQQAYNIGRDLISKIVFPNNDNRDMTDKKGLQRVHVYGNKSFYKEDMKEVDYYRLDVKVYNFLGKEIVNTETNPHAVADALKTLNGSFGKSKSTYKVNDKGFIEIHFAKPDLYTFEQIRDNEFDQKNNNNVTFTLSTKSSETSAKYTFVAVEGINQYCQEGLKTLDERKSSSDYSVLQINFGLGPDVKNNTPFNIDIDKYWFIYGNGYTINADACCSRRWSEGNDFGMTIFKSLNTSFIGANKSTLTYDKISLFDVHSGVHESLRDFKYVIIENFVQAINLSVNNCDVHFNKCLFKGFLKGTFFSDGTNKNTSTIEDSIFFDAAGFPIIAFNAKLRFKGFVDIYNFHNKEILQHIPNLGDISFLWPVVEAAALAKGMVSIGADGRNYINSFMVGAYYETYFYVGQNEKGEDIYELSDRGNPKAAKFVAQYINVGIPGRKLSANLWATVGKNTYSDAPDYYSEFDKDGNMRLDLLYLQMDKITRIPRFF